MDNPQNANPTILSIADLPTRKPAASTKPKSALAALAPSYASDPFLPSHVPDLITDDDDDDDDQIDPQEIYGPLSLPTFQLSLPAFQIAC